MRLISWAALGFGIAAAIPLEKSHEIHLPYFPQVEENAVDSYLSLTWQMANGSLYANGDPVFPPSASMQLHAPRYESARDTPMGEKDVQLSYYLQVRPLSTDEVGATTNIVRVSMELLDLNGKTVTDNTVNIDMLVHPDHSHHLTRIRVDPATGLADPDPDTSRVYKHSPFWAPFSRPPPPPHDRHGPHRPHHPHHGPHDHHRPHTFVGLMGPVVLPAMMGAVAGLAACVFGYTMGHCILSLWRQFGGSKTSESSKMNDVENGTAVDKSNLLVPETADTEFEDA
ncbi:hypothetical protein N7492_002669 [Penicillium capsulatum]|uniref:Uncharacterized protein n=1 Tax=Penicillium capsulatum TaxID=69766 RepID=A0A9W9II83_9EURO|nr:hypothetical protein N7492_002669 [Penicillium capsulatum]KAJ6122732.1 hypothetical protein N7512_005197 [Penicillium capsulatum]